MAAFVFTDKALERNAGRFVWLKIDIENSKNAAFLRKASIPGVPTLFVIDPRSEAVALRWVGAATVPQLEKILEDGSRAVAGKGKGVEEALARADKLYGAGKNAEAAKAYREALKLAPAGWSRYGRTVESLLFALSSTDEYESCATIARDAFGKLRKTASAANIAASGLDCAMSLGADHPKRASLVAEFRKDALEVVSSNVRMAADDRSAVYQILVDERERSHDAAGAKEMAQRWATFLEHEAAAAKNAEGRAVFDSHRVSAYLAAGEPQRAIPMLEAAERDLPDDYNPPARLAYIYSEMGRFDEALAASDRALAKIYGPRKLGVLRTRADIYKGKGDAASARATLEEAIRYAEALPEGQKSERTIAGLKKKLESIQ